MKKILALVAILAIGLGSINAQDNLRWGVTAGMNAVSYTHLRAHETGRNLVCRLLLEKKKNETTIVHNRHKTKPTTI